MGAFQNNRLKSALFAPILRVEEDGACKKDREYK